MKSYTDIEQSKKLIELGIDVNTADMRYGYIAPYEYSDRMFDGGYDEVPYSKDFLKRNPNFSENEYDSEFPAWSLVALYGILPNNKTETTTLSRGGWKIEPFEYLDKWFCEYEDDSHSKDFTVSADNPIDACVEMILKLNELKML